MIRDMTTMIPSVTCFIGRRRQGVFVRRSGVVIKVRGGQGGKQIVFDSPLLYH